MVSNLMLIINLIMIILIYFLLSYFMHGCRAVVYWYSLYNTT